MSNTIKAKRVQVCIFTLADKEYQDQPPAAQAAFDAFAAPVIQLQQLHNGKAPIEVEFCPLTYDENVLIVNRNGLDYSRLPAAQIYAEYPDGSAKYYFLKSGLGGIDFVPEATAPYIKALLYNLGPSKEPPILCKLVPPLCNLGGYAWLALTVFCTYRASQARNIGKAAWGAAALASGEAFVKRGGLEMLKKAAGIGKVYDQERIKPGGRVDKYWGRIEPDALQYGVSPRAGGEYREVQAAIHHFGLYSIEFGNWLNQMERADFMFASLATLSDMAKVIGAPHRAMGLGGTLSLAFGARGSGRASATYEGFREVINLTKTSGRFALCHEWGHAVDKRLGWPSGHRSGRKQPDYSGKAKGSAAYLFEHSIDIVLWQPDGSQSSYQVFLIKSGSEYLNRRAEIWARMSEAFFWLKFKSAGISNTWGVPAKYARDWPDQALMAKVLPTMSKIFSLLK